MEYERLKENEWNTINKVLLELYELENMNDFSEKLLKLFRMLIPYSQGCFLMFDEHVRIDTERSANIGMTDEMWDAYVNDFFEKDYLNYVMDYADSTITYKDTQMFEEKIRTGTEFYKEFLKPNNIPYGCGIILMKDGELLGVINLFRSMSLGDFSDKDIYILEILKLHLRNITRKLIHGHQELEAMQTNHIEMFANKMRLSDRELEVMQFLLAGYTNAEISEKLVISLSTVKKHIYHIFTKAGVKSRSQLSAAIRL